MLGINKICFPKLFRYNACVLLKTGSLFRLVLAQNQKQMIDLTDVVKTSHIIRTTTQSLYSIRFLALLSYIICWYKMHASSLNMHALSHGPINHQYSGPFPEYMVRAKACCCRAR